MSRSQRIVCWIAGLPTAGTLVGLAASIAPPRLRLIGLFALVLGGMIGWAGGRLAVSLRMSRPRIAWVVGLMSGCTGFTVFTVINWQTYARDLKTSESPGMGQAMVSRMLEAAARQQPDSPEARRALSEFRTSAAQAIQDVRQRRSFRGFLSHRVTGLHWGAAAAVWVFACETMLAGLASAVIVRQAVRQPFCEICDEFLTLSRSHQFQPPLPGDLVQLIGGNAGSADHQVTVRVLSCPCRKTPAMLHVRISDRSTSHVTSVIRNLSHEERKQLASLLDKADGTGLKS